MKLNRTLLIMLLLATFTYALSSCAKDNDLFYESIIEQEEEIEETDEVSDEDPDGETDPETPEDPDDPETPDDPTDPEPPVDPTDPTNSNKIVGTYYPSSSAEITDPARADHKAIITESFDCNGCTFAANQTIEPAGGVITGSNINVNGAFIENTYKQAFGSSVTFSELYENSRISPELFGATSGDSGDDNDAIDAMVDNCLLAAGSKDGSYIKNKPSYYRRTGKFNWNMNGSVVKTTSAANFDNFKVSVDFVFHWVNISPTIYNGEFDGTRSYGRLMYLDGQEHYVFRDLYIHDYYSPTTVRAKAFQINLRPVSKGFTYGEFSNIVIKDIIAQGDGNYNNSPAGVSKGWSYGVYEINHSNPFTVIHKDNKVSNIIGDDAEALYMINKSGGSNLNNESRFILEREDYRYCSRRAIKANVSNVSVTDSYFEEIPDSMFSAAQQMGTMVDFFSISSGYMIKDIVFKRNILKSTSDSAHYHFLSLSEVDGADVSENVIEHANVENYAGIRLGSGTSTYDGKLKDISIKNNEFINCGVQVLQRYAPVNNQPITIDNNTFNYTPDTSDSWGQHQSALRFSATSGSYGYVNMSNSTINVNISSSSNIFNGAISSLGANIVNCTLDNVDIVYTNSGVNRPFGYMQGNFDSSNLVQDCSLSGDVGAGAIEVSGTQSVRVVNSTDSNGNPISVK
ncbi:hypothetical protein [Flagellimonas sp. 2504JD4-2]